MKIERSGQAVGSRLFTGQRADVGRLAAAIWRDVACLAGLLLVVFAATVAAYNNPLTSLLAADSQPEDAFSRFHTLEQRQDNQRAFRWTKGDSRICLAQWGYASRSVLHLVLGTHPAIQAEVAEVRLHINDQPFAMLALLPGERHYQMLLSGQQQHQDDLCITLASETARIPGDRREVGAAFQVFALQRLPAAGLSWPARLQALLNLALAVPGFWLLRRGGLSPLAAALLIALPAMLLGAGVAAGWIVPGLEAAHTMLPMVGSLALIASGAAGLHLAGPAMERYARGLPPRLSRDLLAMLFWSIVLCGTVWLLQAVYTHDGVWPLKAGVWPGFTPLVLLPATLFAGWLALLLALLRSPQPKPAPALALVIVGAVLLPVVLKVSVRGWDLLYYTFAENPTDYIRDVPLIGGDPLTFLRSYVALSPVLAGHNSNHPPGSVLLLWSVTRFFPGEAAVTATWTAISLSSLGAAAAYWLGQRLGGAQIALLAGALTVVMPFQQIYTVTSMDGVFAALMACALVASFLALEPQARPGMAALAGGLIALGLLLTYATTQLIFFGAAVALLALVRGQPLSTLLRQGAIIAATLAAFYLLLGLTTGFHIIEAAVQAMTNNSQPFVGQMSRPTLPWLPTLAHYSYYLWVNIAPFAWYLAPWGLAALTPPLAVALRSARQPDSRAALALSLLALVAGMWLSGLFVREVERIWGFVYPLAAVLMALHIWQGETQREKLWRAALYLTLFFAQSAIMRMLLNTYW